MEAQISKCNENSCMIEGPIEKMTRAHNRVTQERRTIGERIQFLENVNMERRSGRQKMFQYEKEGNEDRRRANQAHGKGKN